MLTAREGVSWSLVSSAAAERLRRPLRARRRGPADDPRDRLLGMALVARVDALGREGDEDVRADLQAPLAQRLDEQLARAADVGRRRQDEQLPGDDVGQDGVAGGAQRREIGAAPPGGGGG